MATVTVNDSNLYDIADSIRAKLGVQTTYKPSQMADAIDSISGGGITPTGTKSITANGTYDVTQYASAEVDVPTGSTPVINSLSVTENGTYTAPTGVDGYSPVVVNVSGGGDSILDGVISGGSASVSSNVTTLKKWALANMTLTGISLPNLTTAGESAFQNTTCNPSRTVIFPELQTVNISTFRYFKGVTKLVLPKVGAINKATLFGDMTDLEALDFGSSVYYDLATWSCSGCAKLAVIVIRKSGVVGLSNVNSLNDTCFASDGTGGILYVPNDYISSYQAANVWSTILGYANNQIKSIESTATDPTAPIDLTRYYIDGTEIPT